MVKLTCYFMGKQWMPAIKSAFYRTIYENNIRERCRTQLKKALNFTLAGCLTYCIDRLACTDFSDLSKFGKREFRQRIYGIG